jgi:two-component system KDP operon response regulator KdpE
VSTAVNGATAVSEVAIHPPDLVILDLGLPDIDGLKVITHIRRLQQELPIIVLSARTGSGDKVAALDLGAVDYVTKPFNMDELLARLRAATRRVDVTEPVPRSVTFGQVTIDLDAHLIVGADGGEPIHLTPTEWRMLEVLLSRPGSLVTTAEVLTAMRGNPENTERSYLRIYMQQLRRKLEPDPSRPRHLLTEPGMGYRFKP